MNHKKIHDYIINKQGTLFPATVQLLVKAVWLWKPMFTLFFANQPLPGNLAG